MGGREEDILSWVDSQKGRLLDHVSSWAEISSSSLDATGLQRMADSLGHAFGTLGAVRRISVPPRTWIDDESQAIEQPLGDVLSIRHVAPRERLSILLAIHYDTVYPAGDQAPRVELVDHGKKLRGPGVADAKGGIAVMFAALEAFMKLGASDLLSWEVLLNADEELGSPGSARLLAEAAGRHDIGFVFEPSLDDAGTLAASRKGSGNFHVVISGRAAHAGRAIGDGRNAVVAAARLATTLADLDDVGRDVTVNVAAIHGGVALNVVPDRAVLRVNARAATEADAAWLVSKINEAVAAIDQLDGFRANCIGGFHCPPKPLDEPTQRLLQHVATCAQGLGLTIMAKPTGGACDGNKLAAAGLPTIDTLGVRGGGIHSPDEYLVVESLAERASLVAILLARLAEGSLNWPRGFRSGAARGGPSSCS
jgi:glutamate carboxypeptidase